MSFSRQVYDDYVSKVKILYNEKTLKIKNATDEAAKDKKTFIGTVRQHEELEKNSKTYVSEVKSRANEEFGKGLKAAKQEAMSALFQGEGCEVLSLNELAFSYLLEDGDFEYAILNFCDIVSLLETAYNVGKGYLLYETISCRW